MFLGQYSASSPDQAVIHQPPDHVPAQKPDKPESEEPEVEAHPRLPSSSRKLNRYDNGYRRKIDALCQINRLRSRNEEPCLALSAITEQDTYLVRSRCPWRPCNQKHRDALNRRQPESEPHGVRLEHMVAQEKRRGHALFSAEPRPLPHRYINSPALALHNLELVLHAEDARDLAGLEP